MQEQTETTQKTPPMYLLTVITDDRIPISLSLSRCLCLSIIDYHTTTTTTTATMMISLSRWLATRQRSSVRSPIRRIAASTFTVSDHRDSSASMMQHHRQRQQQQRSPFSTAKQSDLEPLAVAMAIEERYTKKTPIEHVLLRPGMYVGPNERMPPAAHWVLEPSPPLPPEEESPAAIHRSQYSRSLSFRMKQQQAAVVPALIKIFDEILVNAADNRLRHEHNNYAATKCTRVDVTIHPGSENTLPFVQVVNDGPGIPIHLHSDEQIYLPEMLFGHLLTGSNFDDSEKRLVGGRHGYGAKLTNIFSQQFIVETLDAASGLLYRQTWKHNMTQVSPPVISNATTTGTDNRDYTSISFVPDLPKLTGDADATVMSPDDYNIMCRRVMDVAGCAAGQLQVTLNGINVSMASFEQYIQLYRRPEALPMVYEHVNERWKVAIGLSERSSLESHTFVNAMATTRGGTHVQYLINQVIQRIQDVVAKTHPHLIEQVSAGLVKKHLFVACDALIENPTFDSQMKEYLTAHPNSFGSTCILSERFFQKLIQPQEDGGPGIIEAVVQAAQGRQQANLLKQVGGKKSKRQLLAIPKLEDAHQAGTDNGHECTLILTEGDSAKALAVAGLEVIGRDTYGVYPLRGKVLNVRQASVAQLANNKELKALCSILGLDFLMEYGTLEERKTLRYGSVMLMTDQDNDGSHIKGLVINFFRHFWPKLLMPPIDDSMNSRSADGSSFLSSFITPLLKATRKGSKETISFFTMAEYRAWKDGLDPVEAKKYSVKYYKGLGTSTHAEAKEYFSNFEKHLRPFRWNSDVDGELLDMVFDKERAAERREWIINEYDENVGIDGDMVSYEDFINKEMVHFSHADNLRSLPSVIDGLKPSQRKVLYACFKRKLTSEVKVAQLSGYCAEHTAYHHGEASLQATIIGMAQDFVGSNNINLLEPQGQFGTRLSGGDDAASPRYIFTQLSPVSRLLFPEVDDAILDYREDDGQMIEPEFYCPIIPLLLVNGSQGIGTGWSTFIAPHNPLDLIDYVRSKLDGVQQHQLPVLRPFARGFDGAIEENPDGDGYVSIGRASKTSKSTIVIDELPLRIWTDAYKTTLIKMRDRGEIQHFVENHTTSKVRFEIHSKTAQLNRMVNSGLENVFKLRKSLPMTNMNAFDSHNRIRKFDSAESIIEEYFPVRLGLYYDRQSLLESETKYGSAVSQNKARFIEAVSNGRIKLTTGRKTKEETVMELKSLGYSSVDELQRIRNDNTVFKRRLVSQEPLDDNEEDATLTIEHESPTRSDFDYLLNMPLSSLTSERIQELLKDAAKKDDELKLIQSKSAEDLWRSDLDKLAQHL